VLFGGNNGSLIAAAETWEWDGTNWTQITPINIPPGRWFSAMSYDSLHQRTIMFGGFGGLGSTRVLADTWEWDGVNWLQRTSLVSPSKRRSHAMSYDAVRARTVLFGGVNDGYLPTGDTWEWDGVSWNQVATPVSPSARIDHTLVFDSIRGRS